MIMAINVEPDSSTLTMEKPLHEKICLSWFEADWLFYSQKQGWMHMLVFALLFWTPCYPMYILLSMRGSRIFRQGGGVWVNLTKKALTTFFLVLSLFYWSQMVNFEENYHFSRFQRGSNIFQFGGGGGGGPTFSKGVLLLIPYRNPYNLWFSRGVRTLWPPSGSALAISISRR